MVGFGVKIETIESVNYVCQIVLVTNFITCLSVVILWINKKAYIPKELLKRPNVVRFEKLMNTKDLQTLFKLGKFCKEILVTFKVISVELSF